MGFVLALMYVALKVSDWVVTEGSSIAGAVTNRISGAAKGIGRFGGGLPIRGIAAGGGALGRVTLGAGGQALNRSAWARGLEARGGVAGLFGRGIRGAGKFAGNRTFDVRNIPGAGNVLGAGGALNVGTGKSGGYIKRTADAAAAKEKRGKDLEPTAGEKQKALEKTKAGFKYQNTKENNTRILSDAEEKIKKANDEIAELDKYGYGADEAKKQKEDALKTVQAAKEALAENEKYLISESKKISGEGSSKVYGESLLKSFNLASGNPGFVTRSSQEAAAKLLKEKSKKDKLAEAATDYAKEEGSDETPPDGGGSSGGGGAKGTGGGSSTPASGTDSTSTAGTGTHASFNQNLGPKVEQNTEVLKRIERLLRKQSNSAQYTSTASSPEINVTELGKAIGKSVAKNLEKSGTINVAPRSRSNPSTTPHQPPKPSNDNEQNPPEVKAA